MTGIPQPTTSDAAQIVISSAYRRTISVGDDQVVIEQTVSVPQGTLADALAEALAQADMIIAPQTEMIEARAVAVRAALEAAAPATPELRRRLDDACAGIAPRRAETIAAACGVRLDAPTCAGARAVIRAIRVCQALDALDEPPSSPDPASSGVPVWTTEGPYPALLRPSSRTVERLGLAAQPGDAANVDATADARKDS